MTQNDSDLLWRQIRAMQSMVDAMAGQLELLGRQVRLMGEAPATTMEPLEPCPHTEKTEIGTMTEPTAWFCKSCGVRGH